jgi:hypothetical protein
MDGSFFLSTVGWSQLGLFEVCHIRTIHQESLLHQRMGQIHLEIHPAILATVF